MVSANGQYIATRIKFVQVGLVLTVLVFESGCAQLKSFGNKEWPSLGSKEATALREERTPGESNKGDLYAKSLGKGETLSNKALAGRLRRNRADAVVDGRDRPEIDRVSAGQSDIDLPRRSRSQTPMVVLQPPEELPPLPGADKLVQEIQDHPSTESVEPKPWAGASKPTDPDVSPEQPESVASAEPVGPTLGSILTESRKTLDGIATYQVKMNHQERVNGNLNPAEDALLSIRREPKAVRIEWPSGPNKGREVLYVADQKGGMMHVHMPNPIIPTLTMAPNSPLATRNSRHPITEAGLDTILSKMEDALRAQEANDKSFGKMTYEGEEKAAGLDRPAWKILRVTPTGERWVVYIDSETKLPCMVQANAPNGELLERYIFSDPKLELPELSELTAFNPDSRWGASKGLFSRLGRAAANGPATETR